MKNKKNSIMQADWVNDPFRAFTTMVREPLFEYPKRFREMMNEGYEMPKVDIADNGSSFRVKVDIPAVDKKDIKLKVTSNAITIRAEKTEESEKSSADYYAKERSSIGFYRVVELPEAVKSNTAKAKYANGTLSIDVQKEKGEEGSEVKVD
ncbi:MAG: Hsp20/alpha crystallin family protein [Candidatus Micrarchaeaceae archaeon]